MTDDILTTAAALAEPLPDGPWRTAPWQPHLVLAAPWAEDSAAIEDRGPFLSIACSVGSIDNGLWASAASAKLAELTALLPDLVLALAAAESEALRYRIEQAPWRPRLHHRRRMAAVLTCHPRSVSSTS